MKSLVDVRVVSDIVHKNAMSVNEVFQKPTQIMQDIETSKTQTPTLTPTTSTRTTNIEYRTVTTGVSPFWASKHAREACKNWEAFYKRNGTNFFRDRNWTSTSSSDGFPQLSLQHDPPAILLEAGCGVANTIWPLLSTNPTLNIKAFDFSSHAIQLIQSHPQYPEYETDNRLRVFKWDFVNDDLIENDVGEVDFITLIFVLSSVPPNKQVDGVRRLVKCLNVGGRLLFRDYGVGDAAQKRFKSRNRIHDNYFVRQDGTLSFFFDEIGIKKLMEGAGLKSVYVRKVERTIENRKEGLAMQRVFLQAEFEKV